MYLILQWGGDGEVLLKATKGLKEEPPPPHPAHSLVSDPGLSSRETPARTGASTKQSKDF